MGNGDPLEEEEKSSFVGIRPNYSTYPFPKDTIQASYYKDSTVTVYKLVRMCGVFVSSWTWREPELEFGRDKGGWDPLESLRPRPGK